MFEVIYISEYKMICTILTFFYYCVTLCFVLNLKGKGNKKLKARNEKKLVTTVTCLCEEILLHCEASSVIM